MSMYKQRMTGQPEYKRITLWIPPDLIEWIEGKEQMNAAIVESMRASKDKEEATRGNERLDGIEQQLAELRGEIAKLHDILREKKD